MAPTIVFDRAGRPVLALGSPGGAAIITYVAQALIATLDWGMTLQRAVEMGHVVNRNGPTSLETGSPVVALGDALKARGQEIKTGDWNSGLHGIDFRGGHLSSGIDPRREGAAIGR